MRGSWRAAALASVLLASVAPALPVGAQEDPGLAAVPAADLAAEARIKPADPGAEVVPGELVVTWKDGVVPGPAAATLAAPGADPAGTVEDATLIATVPGEEAVVAAELAADPRVETVEPNLVRRLAWNDPMYGAQRDALELVRVPRAWTRSRGRGVRVAVLDSGIDPTHPDLTGNLVHVSSTVGDSGRDNNGHGTAVAGIIAAVGGNGRGIVGVAPSAKLISIKVSSADGASDFDIVRGLDRAVALGADVINISLGGAGLSQVLDRGLRRTANAGVLVVVAAGNEWTASPMYPAAHPSVLAVGALRPGGALASFSNHGPNVDITGPGVGLRSTAPGARYAGRLDGTSFSSPMVAGIAALLQERRPGLRGPRLGDALELSARDAGAPGSDAAFGSGIVDAAAALRLVARAGVSRPAPVSGSPSDFPAGARTFDGSTSGKIEVEYDEDWFVRDLSSPRRLTIRVAPPRKSAGSLNGLDIVMEVYNSKLRRLAWADRYWWGDYEQVSVRVPAGRVFLRVLNYGGSRSNLDYTVRTSSDAISGNFTRPQTRAMWARRVNPANRATTLGHRPEVSALLSTVAQQDAARIRLRLRDGRTGKAIASTRAYNASTGTLRARVTDFLPSGTPVVVSVVYVHPTEGERVIDTLNYAVRP